MARENYGVSGIFENLIYFYQIDLIDEQIIEKIFEQKADADNGSS